MSMFVKTVLKKSIDCEDIVNENDKVVIIFQDPEREYWDDATVRTLDGKIIGYISHGDDSHRYTGIRNLHIGTISEITSRTYTVEMELGDILEPTKYPKINVIEVFKMAFKLLEVKMPKAVETFQLRDLHEHDYFRLSNMLHIIRKVDEYYALHYLDSDYERSLNLVRTRFTFPAFIYAFNKNPDHYMNDDSQVSLYDGFKEFLGASVKAPCRAHNKMIEEHNGYDFSMEWEDDDLLTFK